MQRADVLHEELSQLFDNSEYTKIVEYGERDVVHTNQSYLFVGKSLHCLCQYEQAIRCFKKGLVHHPNDPSLSAGLQAARVCHLEMLHQISGESESEHEVATLSEYTMSENPDVSHSIVPVDWDDSNLNVSRLTYYLRCFIYYICIETLQLWPVTLSLALISTSIALRAILLYSYIMALFILFFCGYRSRWKASVHDRISFFLYHSQDKLGMLQYVPLAAYSLPMFFSILGQLKFMLFLHQHFALEFLVTLGGIIILVGRKDVTEGKVVKVLGYTITVGFWVFYKKHFEDVVRLMAPLLLDSGALLLMSVPSESYQSAMKRACSRWSVQVYSEVGRSFGLCVYMNFVHDLIRFWQTPTVLSYAMVQEMLQEAFSMLEVKSLRLFRPEVERMKSATGEFTEDNEFYFLISYLRENLTHIPPPRWIAYVALLARKSPSYIVFCWIITFYGFIPIPLLPFLYLERHGVLQTYAVIHEQNTGKIDTMDVFLFDAPARYIWINYKAAIQSLECGANVVKAAQVCANVAQSTIRIKELTEFAAKWNSEGTGATIHDLPKHIANLFALAKDSVNLQSSIRSLYSRYYRGNATEETGKRKDTD